MINEHSTMSTEKILSWLKDFKDAWLIQNISNDRRLLDLLTNKLSELEHILTGNTQSENQLSAIDEYQCDHSSDIEQVVLPTQQAPEGSLPTPPHVHNHVDDNVENHEKLYRPAIRIPRIPLAEAAHFIPDGWKPTVVKGKRGRKKGSKKLTTVSPRENGVKKSTRRSKVPPPPTLGESLSETSTSTRKSTRTRKSVEKPSPSINKSIPSTNGDKKKGRRKLRAREGEDDDLNTLGNLSQTEHTNGDMDCEQVPRFMGLNGILSQTRRGNETTTTCAFEHDFTIRARARPSADDEIPSTHSADIDNDAMMAHTDVAEPMNILGDVDAAERERLYRAVVETDDNDSLFTSLELTRDRPPESSSTINNNSIINYNDCIEDISNDGIDPPPSSSSPNLPHLPLTT